MVAEGLVLYGIQHLQHGAGRVTPKIAGHLIDLIQQEDGVLRTRLLDMVQNRARDGADIGAAVSADLRLIPSPAQAPPAEFTAHGMCNGARNAGFSRTRRADKAEDRPFDVLFLLANGQVLHDALFHLIQAEMLIIQRALGIVQIKIILGTNAPRQF